ncbi:hypothetical protein G647_03909 [Cladophialophora carrionii CBS 160.54]|uniref:Apc15p protein-domain-containing protein n=1 Tax=Cladophialophora carrionii CBS 160.54 TaxID=1279043 RepID=V9DCG4_9EURO|nr:uncharacterized protein G647_03909 [Cladophialophora carrionii CBS 160.54]ETI24540.1 hypothetical protein G647_03909 [Cladophialophora carrionii CBS 160.54]
MFLSTSLPLLPPPPSSLFPPITAPASDAPTSTPAAHHHHHHRRQKHNAVYNARNNTLLALSTDERTVSQRKMAIAMYGYSWLKPAGCAKTMLGRREEEVEREEVERQLREVELQERLALETEEQERMARAQELGEVEEGRDLDEDIPDADDPDPDADYESEEEDGAAEEGEDEDGMEMGMAADLDDEIPDADDQEAEDDDEPLSPVGADGGWVYDTRREPDTDDEDQLPQPLPPPRHRDRGHARHTTVAGVRVPLSGSEYDYDERDAEDLANAMLDGDDMYEADLHGPGRSTLSGDRDLDDEVPDADDDQAWEHTDTELEESEMDISILPQAAQPGHGRLSGGGQESPQLHPQFLPRSSARAAAPRSSGPWITGPSPLPNARFTPAQRSVSTRAARIVSGNRQRPYRPDLARPTTRHQLQQTHTPELLDTPPLAAEAGVDIDVDLDPDVDDEEVDTDLEGEDAGVDINTPDPFAAPEHARAPAQAGTGDQGRQLRAPAIGVPRARGQGGRGGATGAGNTSPSRAAAARNWLDGAAATLGVGGSRDGSASARTSTNVGARRTLFQRATRRRNAGAGTDADVAAELQTGGPATSSGGLFSSPNVASNGGDGDSGGAGGGGGGAGGGEWDTPESASTSAPPGQTQDQGRRVGRRRSGRFLAGRSRAAE